MIIAAALFLSAATTAAAATEPPQGQRVAYAVATASAKIVKAERIEFPRSDSNESSDKQLVTDIARESGRILIQFN